jgi:hypothetical protein
MMMINGVPRKITVGRKWKGQGVNGGIEKA